MLFSLLIAASVTLLSTGAVLGQGAGSAGGQGGMGTSAGSGGPAVGPPPVLGQAPPPMAPAEVRGVAEEAPSSTTGLAKPADDGISTKIVPARPCSTAARGTDGTTTCVGIPAKR
jgi:hypothetical protein